MASGFKNAKEGNDSSKFVLDYYKKYSQNKKLPKYFSGSPVSYLPKIEDDDTIQHPIIIPNHLIDFDQETCARQPSLDTSRASSVMSNRKLEWDNGADIGYENIQDVKVLRKSISLPLITDVKQSEFDMEQIAFRMDHPRSEGSSDSNVKIIVLSFSSSSDGPNPEIDNVYSSSSSQPEEKKCIATDSSNSSSNALLKNSGKASPTSQESSNDKITKFAGSLSYLKQKIGLPGAHSTPKYLEARKSDPDLYSSTPAAHDLKRNERCKNVTKTSKSDEEVKRTELKRGKTKKPTTSIVEILPVAIGKDRNKSESTKGQVLTYKNNKVVNLALTKPVTVECMCSPKTEKKIVSKTTKQASVGIQTDTLSEQELIQIIHKSDVDNKNQSLIYFEYPESDKTNCATQTTSDAASPCDSFKYYQNSADRKDQTPLSDSSKFGSKTDTPVIESPENVISSSERKNETNGVKENEENVDPDNENSCRTCSDDICLGDVISTSQLNNVGESVEKSIHLLHRLLKSKKYDPITKKRYIKKIMQKITESKYFEESSNSSDLFRPKKTKVKDLPQPPKSPTSDTSDEKSEKGVVHVNLPLYLALTEKLKVSPRKKKLGVKTFIQDFLPNQNVTSHEEISSPPEIIPIDLRDTKKNCFTLTNNEFSVKRDHTNQENSGEMQASHQTDTSLEKHYELSSAKSANYQNWREDKTLSEKILEEKSGTIYGKGDCLVKFAEKEREYQISWINNEISHLGKLKGLLEKPTGGSKLNDPTENIKKTTTVYTVSEEHDQPISKEVTFTHNYVIETNLGTDSTVPGTFKLQGKKYTVTDLTTKTSDTKPIGNVVSDIEVISSDSVTSIKVSTFCETCKRFPCICTCLKCRKVPCICNKLKNAVCRTCHTIPCICHINSTSKHHAHCLLDENICWRCNKCPCQCPSPSAASSLSGKTICLVCHRTPCICVRKSSGKGVLSKTCLSCGKYPCVYGKSKTSTISDEYTGTFVVACPPKSAFDCMPRKKCSTFPLSLKEKCERKDGKCPVCKRCPCLCEALRKVLDTKCLLSGTNPQYNCLICEQWPCVCATSSKYKSKKCPICGKCPCICEILKAKLPKKCSVCGDCPCICETIKRDYLNRSTSVSVKSLCPICEECPCICETINARAPIAEKCSVCGQCPCFCEALNRDYFTRSTSISVKSLRNCSLCGKCPCICETVNARAPITEKCSVCGQCPCFCEALNRDYFTRSTSISVKSLRNCSLCGKYPCICDLLKKDFNTRSTSVSRKSLIVCPICGKCPCICGTTISALPLKTCTESRTGSLKRVFENCNCSTQTNCTCDFVEKLIERFNKVEATSAMLIKDCKSNCLQTEEKVRCDCQNVGIQTQIDTKHEILQTAKCAVDYVESKISQTERCCQNIGIQTANLALHTQTDVCGDGLALVEVVKCNEEETKKGISFSAKVLGTKSLSRCEAKKVDVACACEITQGTQTLGDKRVVLTCSSQASSNKTVSPAERSGDFAQSAGISNLKKYKKGSSPDKHCACCTSKRSKVRPKTTIITEEFESKTESMSDARYVTSSKSSTVVTSSYNATMDSASDPSSDPLVICICCKEKYPTTKISMIGSPNQNFPLCTLCLQRRPILTSLCYAGPEHVCTCYKPAKNDPLHDIKKTMVNIFDLDFCTCTVPSRVKNSEYCTHCRMRLKNTAKTKNGIAYTLTLEDKSPDKVRTKRKKKRPSLEEIRIRVPCPYAKKEHKEKVNLCTQDGDKDGVTVGFVERIIKQGDGKKCSRVKVVCSKTKRSRRSNLTLQDYLKKNKPDFIDTAENRRLTLFSSKSERELKKDDAKLRFFEDNRCHCDKLKKENTKLFTEQEMKAITRRNYAKLPEVQQKNNERRERRLRNADKFIVDVFSTKIRNSALKGKRDFPLSQNIVSLPKT